MTYLTPNMQRILVHMRQNGHMCSFQSQCVYRTKSFYTDMNRLVRDTPWITKKSVIRPSDNRFCVVYELTMAGMFLSFHLMRGVIDGKGSRNGNREERHAL
jgi:hypothetical protein